MSHMGRGRQSGGPGRVEGSGLQDTPSLRPFLAADPAPSTEHLTRQVAVFGEESPLAWENCSQTKVVSCPGVGNDCMKYMLPSSPTLASTTSLKEEPLKFPHLCFKYKNATFKQKHCASPNGSHFSI